MFVSQCNYSPLQTHKPTAPTMGAKGPKVTWGPLDCDQPKSVARKVNPVDDKLGNQARLLTIDQVLTRANISRSYLHSLRKEHRCPAPIKLSPGRRGAVRFVAAEVEAWITSWIASRPDEDGTPNDLPGV